MSFLKSTNIIESTVSNACASKRLRWSGSWLFGLACLSLSGCDYLNNASNGTSTDTRANSPNATMPAPTNTPNSGTGSKTHIEIPHCVDQATVQPSLDSSPSPGINGHLILKRALGTHAVTIRSQPKNEVSVVEHTPNSDGVAAQLEVIYDGGEFRHLHSKLIDCTPGGSCAGVLVVCVDTLQVDVKLRLRSNDGAFAEEWPATLVMKDPADPDLKNKIVTVPAEYAKVDVELGLESFRPDSLKGSFRVTSVQTPNLHSHKIEFHARFDHGRLHSAAMWHRLNTQDELGNVHGFRTSALYKFEPTTKQP